MNLFIAGFRFGTYPSEWYRQILLNCFQFAIIGSYNGSRIKVSGSKQKGICEGHFMRNFNTTGFKGNIPRNSLKNCYGQQRNIVQVCSSSSASYRFSAWRRSIYASNVSTPAYNPHNASMASSARSFLGFTGGLFHSSRRVAFPAGISCGTSIKSRWSAGISTVCSKVIIINNYTLRSIKRKEEYVA